MCVPSKTEQGRIREISADNPGRMISGYDVKKPKLKHVLYFVDPTTTPICEGRKYSSQIIYKFDKEEYDDVKQLLTSNGVVVLFGEPAVEPLLSPVNWMGA